MGSSADAIIQTLLAGTGAGRTPGDFQQQGDQHALAQQSIQHNNILLTELQKSQAQEAQYQSDVADYVSDPTPAKVFQLAMKYPDKAKALTDAAKAKDDAQTTSDQTWLSQVYSAASNGRTDLVRHQLVARRDAEKAAGVDTSELDDALQQLDSGDPDALKHLKAATLTQIYAHDPAKFAEVNGLGKDKTHVITAGGALVDDTGKELYRAAEPTKYEKLAPGESLYQVGGPPSANAVGSTGALDPHQFYKDFVLPHEGGYAAHDANGAPVNHGINQSANPGVDVKNLTEDQAAEIFANKYYAASGSANLPPALAAVNADTSFINPKRAAQFLQQSGGDVNKYMTMRQSWMNSLVKNDPDKYGKYATAWAKRNADLSTYASQLGGGATPQAASGPKLIAQAPATDPNSLMSPEELNFYAEKVANGADLPPLGMGKDAALLRRQILAKAADVALSNNIGGAQSNLIHADLKANTKSLGTLTQLRTLVDSAERTASLNADQVLRLAPQGVGGSAPIFNRWIQAGRNSIAGDPAVSKFNVAITTLANEYAKVMTTNTGTGNAVTSDSARAEAHSLINNTQTLQQLQGVVQQMRTDMNNRHISLTQQDQILRGNFSAAAALKPHSASPVDTPGAAPAANAVPATALPPGTPTAINKQTGQRLAKLNGHWVPVQ